MKQKIFTLIMMLALVIVAGKAFAANETTVEPGGTYTYNLSGVSSVLAATATAIYSSAPAIVTQVGTTWTIPAASTNRTVSFTVKYGDETTPAATGDITVTVADASCSNYIKLHITVLALPTLQLAVTDGLLHDYGCQNKNATPSSNVDASIGATANTFTFTVTPTVSLGSGYNYDFTIALTNTFGSASISRASGDGTLSGSSPTLSVSGATSATEVFTVTFTTTTDVAASNFTATISGATLHVTNGGGTYTGTYSPSSDIVNVKAMPAIGSFL